MQGHDNEPKIIEGAEIVIDAETDKHADDATKTPPAEPERADAQGEKKADSDYEGPDNPIRLKNPILINGQKRTELPWSDDLTVEQLFEVEKKAHDKTVANAVMELDMRIHFYLGATLVSNADTSIDVNDLMQLKGRDIFALIRVGRFFATGSED